MKEFDSTDFGNVWINGQLDEQAAKGIDVNNIMNPTAYRITKIVRETKNEFTFRVDFKFPVKHGQFFMLSIPKFGEAPISVSGKGKDYIEFTIRKAGRLTEGIFNLREGGHLSMRGPFGHPWPVEENFSGKGKKLVVITDDLGLTPVKTFINDYYYGNSEIDSLYLTVCFKDVAEVIFKDDLKKWASAEHFTTKYLLEKDRDIYSINENNVIVDNELDGLEFESGTYAGAVDEIPFGELGDDYNVVIVYAPTGMRNIAEKCVKLGVPKEKIWIALERKMQCAVGKCGHCRINGTYVCLEGPVFNYTKASALFD